MERVTDTNSITKKIAEIEQNLQGIAKLGKKFKHLDDKVIQLKNNSDSNTYMLDSIIQEVYYTLLDNGLPHPSYTEFKHQLQNFLKKLKVHQKSARKQAKH